MKELHAFTIVGRSLIGIAFRIRKSSARGERRKVTRARPGGSKHLSFRVAPGTQSVSNSLSFLPARDRISVYSPLRPISNLLSDEYWIHCVSVGERIQRLCDNSRSSYPRSSRCSSEYVYRAVNLSRV